MVLNGIKFVSNCVLLKSVSLFESWNGGQGQHCGAINARLRKESKLDLNVKCSKWVWMGE